MKATYLRLGYIVIFTAIFAGCSDSSDDRDAVSETKDSKCAIEYVFGVWRHTEDESWTELTFTSGGMFVVGSDNPMQLYRFGDYEIETEVDLSSGVTGCRLIELENPAPSVILTCSRVVYRDIETLYISECGSEDVDFTRPYYKTDTVVG